MPTARAIRPAHRSKYSIPEFLGLDSTVRYAINDRVNYILSGSAGEPKSLKDMGNDFIKDFEEFVKEMPGYDLD